MSCHNYPTLFGGHECLNMPVPMTGENSRVIFSYFSLKSYVVCIH